MKRTKPSRTIAPVAVALVAALVLPAGPAAALSGPPAPAREADRAAVRAAMQAFRDAFNAADAEALAARWADEGEYIGEDGVEVRGRSALRDAFAAYFQGSPGAKAEIHPESLRFLSRDTALDEGTVTIRQGAAGGKTRARYTALLAREDGQWHLASLREATDAGHSIDELAWLVGGWKSKDPEGVEIATTFEWAGEGAFLLGRFRIEGPKRAVAGTQVIGVDPATGGLRSWTFEAEGGIVEADWERDGDHWTLSSEGTLADGASVTATSVLRRIDDNHYTLQSVGRAIDDEPLPDMPPVKVTRIEKPAK